MLHHQHILRFVTLWHLLLSTGTAQSHSPSNPQLQGAIKTSLVFVPWDAHVSVVAVDPTATTYLQDNPNPSRNKSNTINCHPEAYDRVTIVNGPSTAGLTIFYTECGRYPAYSHRLECPLTEPNTAICSHFLTSGNSTRTTTETANSSELSPQPCTITAGIEKLGPRSATVATTSGLSTPYVYDGAGRSTTDFFQIEVHQCHKQRFRLQLLPLVLRRTLHQAPLAKARALWSHLVKRLL
ncbi:hypothetical protein GQ44DRAFT_734163 [Phaeosphaeriaceae sp. PMI808]|nr:hypothetical protein GQ44DRAFT_734163 [Phaeosphaeriaceae sp. PMI808]